MFAAMKSGLEGRNNVHVTHATETRSVAAMKSGLEGRNNRPINRYTPLRAPRRNEVRPRRPEQ